MFSSTRMIDVYILANPDMASNYGGLRSEYVFDNTRVNGMNMMEGTRFKLRYDMHQGLNDQYGVQGSPTLVINGAVVDVSRSPEAIKQAVCAGFTSPPKECEQTLSALAYQPGFGLAVDAGGGAAAAAPGCGT